MTDNPRQDFLDALIKGHVDDALMRQALDLKPDDIAPELERAMLMTLSDTNDARLRNVLALALAAKPSQDAVDRITRLLKEPRTRGFQGTLLYALQKMGVRLPLPFLAQIIIFNTREAQEESLAMLEDAISYGDRSNLMLAVETIIFGLSRDSDPANREVYDDALELLLDPDTMRANTSSFHNTGP